MEINIKIKKKIHKKELGDFFQVTFDEMNSEDLKKLTPEKHQGLGGWFSMDELVNYLKHGYVIEARNKEKQLIGALFIGKQNPLTWPDGKKVEIFILSVSKPLRGQGIGSLLMKKAEEVAHRMGAKKIVLNTNVALLSSQHFYQRLGYKQIGTLEDYYDNGNAVFFAKII